MADVPHHLDLTLEPLDVDRDAPLLQQWVTHPRSIYWEMPDADLATVVKDYREVEERPDHDSYLGRLAGEPVFLTEIYDPAGLTSALRDLPELEPGDIGMHVLVGPPAGDPVHGLTTAIMRTVLEACFARPGVRRVVVDPDVDNHKIRALNVRAGFVEVREVDLPSKTAMLSICAAEAFAAFEVAAG